MNSCLMCNGPSIKPRKTVCGHIHCHNCYRKGKEEGILQQRINQRALLKGKTQEEHINVEAGSGKPFSDESTREKEAPETYSITSKSPELVKKYQTLIAAADTTTEDSASSKDVDTTTEPSEASKTQEEITKSPVRPKEKVSTSGDTQCKLETLFKCRFEGCGIENPLNTVVYLPIYGNPIDPSTDETASYCQEAWRVHDSLPRAMRNEASPGGSDSESVDDDALLDTMEKLQDNIADCDEIMGFYQSRKEKDKIVIDIVEGKREQVDEFLCKLFEGQQGKKDFKFVEQSGICEPLVATGAKVAYAGDCAGLLNEHPDRLRNGANFATVACLGIDSIDNYYIITCKHTFLDTEDPSPTFAAPFDSKLTRVSSFEKGFLGAESLYNRFKVLIDISAIKLNEDKKQEIEQRYQLITHDLNQMYSERRLERRHELRNKTVFKHGATTGTTSGVIYEEEYFGKINRFVGHWFVVKSTNGIFAESGDSGALIWDDNDKPIGLVSYNNRTMRDEDENIMNATFGVRLDYCFDVLREKRGININRCKVVGCPLPVQPNRPLPMLNVE